MKQLKYFFLGMSSILLIIPLAGKLLELLYVWLDALKIKPQTIIAEGNKNISLLEEFSRPTQEAYDDDFNDYDDYDEE